MYNLILTARAVGTEQPGLWPGQPRARRAKAKADATPLEALAERGEVPATTSPSACLEEPPLLAAPSLLYKPKFVAPKHCFEFLQKELQKKA